MKALILYEKIASAWKARNLLQNATHCSDIRVNWKISVVRTSLLKFRSVADMALKDGMDADLIIFAGCRTTSLPMSLREWLERWVELRLFSHAALASIDDPGSDRPAVQTSALSDFARRHRLDFITGVDTAPAPEVIHGSATRAVSTAPRAMERCV